MYRLLRFIRLFETKLLEQVKETEYMIGIIVKAWVVILLSSILVVTNEYRKTLAEKNKHGDNYHISTIPWMFLAMGIGEILIFIFVFTIFIPEPVNMTDRVCTVLCALFPCLGVILLYGFIQSIVEENYAEKYFVYRDYLLRKHKINVSDCLWYEEVDGNLRVTLKNKRTVLLSGTAASGLLGKNKVEKLNNILLFNKKRRAGSEKYCRKALKHLTKDGRIVVNMSMKYFYLGIAIEIPVFLMYVFLIWLSFFSNVETELKYDIIVIVFIGILNIGLIATICKSLFWHMYFEPGKSSFVYQPSLFRKITVYYRDCEWYSIGKIHLKLKTKDRTIMVRIPDVMRIDVLVMMLVINGVEER